MVLINTIPYTYRETLASLLGNLELVHECVELILISQYSDVTIEQTNHLDKDLIQLLESIQQVYKHVIKQQVEHEISSG